MELSSTMTRFQVASTSPTTWAVLASMRSGTGWACITHSRCAAAGVVVWLISCFVHLVCPGHVMMQHHHHHPHHYHHHADRSTPPPQRTHTRHRMAALATGTPYRTRPTVRAPARAALFTATHAPSLGRTLCAISWTTAMTPACVPFLLANMVAWRQCGSSTVSRHETGDQRPEERLLLSVGCFCLCVCPSATLQLQL